MTTKSEQLKQKRILHADQMAQYWLGYANQAAENKKPELEQRHLERAQRWLDKLNELEGKDS